jgi:CHRD domain-containing protein
MKTDTRQTDLRRTSWLMVGLTAIVATGCATMSANRPIVLTGAQEVPPVVTGASGRADITVHSFKCPAATSSDNCPTLLGGVSTMGMRGTVAEIREGGPGHTGPVLVTLTKTSDNEWVVPSGTVLSKAQYAEYQEGQLYVNVDSAANGTGEIRAQLQPQGAPFRGR